MSEATQTIRELLSCGRYRIVEIRRLPPLKDGGQDSHAAVLENVAPDPDDTRETVLVALKDQDDLRFVRDHQAGLDVLPPFA